MVDFATYLKLMKQHPAIKQVSEEHRHEIYWGEIFGYWKVADLVAGKIRRGRGDALNIINDDNLNWKQIGIDYRDGHKWMRLHAGFKWEECGRRLRFVEKNRLWWIGDWLNYGETERA